MNCFLRDLRLRHLCHLCTSECSSLDALRLPSCLCLLLCKRLATRGPRFAGLLLSRTFAVILRGFSLLSTGAQVSTFICLIVGAVETLSTMVFPNSMRSSWCFSPVPRNLKFNKISGTNFLDCDLLSSPLILPNLFSNLFVSFMNVLRMSSNCSTSLALSRSGMLLISAAYADFLPDAFL